VNYFRRQEKLELEENVKFIEDHTDGTIRTFNAKRVKYLRENKDFEAWDDVEVFDSRENVNAKCGYMTYNADKGFGYLSQNPVLEMAGKDSIEIKSRKIEYYDDYKKIVAIFDVETLMQDYYLTSDFLIYYGDQEKATYRGEPSLKSELFDAAATEVTLFFNDNNLKKALLSDSCRVDYKVKEFAEKENWVTSGQMEFYFTKGLISECRAYHNVESLYIQEADKAKKQDFILNEASSEKLILYMDDEGYIKQIGLSGKIKGKYTFEGNVDNGDSSSQDR
jgi:lipopolysaccharide export system protein LptA